MIQEGSRPPAWWDSMKEWWNGWKEESWQKERHCYEPQGIGSWGDLLSPMSCTMAHGWRMLLNGYEKRTDSSDMNLLIQEMEMKVLTEKDWNRFQLK